MWDPQTETSVKGRNNSDSRPAGSYAMKITTSTLAETHKQKNRDDKIVMRPNYVVYIYDGRGGGKEENKREYHDISNVDQR